MAPLPPTTVVAACSTEACTHTCNTAHTAHTAHTKHACRQRLCAVAWLRTSTPTPACCDDVPARIRNHVAGQCGDCAGHVRNPDRQPARPRDTGRRVRARARR
eukprot:275731-Chlamydomonas_euryale.AAC.4